MRRISLLASLAFATTALATIGQPSCVSFDSKSSGFPVVVGGKAAPIITDATDSPSVHRVVGDFIVDIKAVSGATAKASNYTSTTSVTKGAVPIIVGTIGTPLIDQVIKASGANVTVAAGQWENFAALQVSNPLPGVAKAYLIVGSDRRGVIYALYELSEQFGVSPWYWWADVPIKKHNTLYALPCHHGTPSVKYRGIFINDEQPALQNWAQEKFTNGTGQPFNHFVYAHMFELLLRLKVNYLWPAMWGAMFGVDDPLNQGIAQYYGIVMGTSHQEPMMRSSPNEFGKFYPGQAWDWFVNKPNITQYMKEGAIRAKPYENIFTVGMRGSGDEPLLAETNIPVLEDIVATERSILTEVFNGTDVTTIPQMWCLYSEVLGYYEQGMKVPDDVTLLWVDDNWGNIRRFPLTSERNRTGGAGVYYHVDYVGNPRDFKWVTSTQLSKIHDQMSTAYDRGADRIWILNVGDLKPYEMSTEFFITLGWEASRWTPSTVNEFVELWATREFNIPAKSATIANIVANVTRFNALRKPELLNSTTFSLLNYREADRMLANWEATFAASASIYNSLPSASKPAYFELVHHAVSASYNLAAIYVNAGKNNLYASQARISTNDLADTVETLFEHDYDFEEEYHTMLNGKWNHMMDQTHVGYYYWQQPMTNSMPPVNRVQKKKQALPGPMRISIEGNAGAWPGDNPSQCAQGYNCPPPTLPTFDTYQPFASRFIAISAGGPNSFSWTLNNTASWIKVSATKGTITRAKPETRIEVSIDWSKVNNATLSGYVTISGTASAPTYQNVVQVYVNAAKRAAPASFKGFVEGDGLVSIEASHSTGNTSAAGISWTILPGYGRTLDGVKPLPVEGNDGKNFTTGTGPSLTYSFYTFNPIKTMTSYIGVGFNAYGADRPLKFAVKIDDESPHEISYVPTTPPGGFPPGWSGNDGFVANSIITATTNHTGIGTGAHTLTLYMIEPAVVLEKFVIDTGGVKPSYLGPPESLKL